MDCLHYSNVAEAGCSEMMLTQLTHVKKRRRAYLNAAVLRSPRRLMVSMTARGWKLSSSVALSNAS